MYHHSATTTTTTTTSIRILTTQDECARCNHRGGGYASCLTQHSVGGGCDHQGCLVSYRVVRSKMTILVHSILNTLLDLLE